jgi:hypothetical protein
VNPLQFRLSSPPKWRVTVGTICGVWIVAALFSVPSALSRIVCVEFEFVYRNIYYQNVVIFELLVSCVLPLCVIAFTYIMTARHLVESSRPISEGTQIPQLNTRKNTAKIVVGLTVVFLISFVPYHALWTYITCTAEVDYGWLGYGNPSEYSLDITNIKKLSYKLQRMYLLSSCFLLINPCLNPVALFYTSSPFRQHLKRYVTCFCKTNSPPTDLELARRN